MVKMVGTIAHHMEACAVGQAAPGSVVALAQGPAAPCDMSRPFAASPTRAALESTQAPA